MTTTEHNPSNRWQAWIAAGLVGLTVVFSVGAVDADVRPPAELAMTAPLHTDDFSAPATDWRPLSGDWSISDGRMVQSTVDGFDYITELQVELEAEFAISVTMAALDDRVGGGLIVGQPQPGSRNGAYMIDFIAEDSFLRWGRYDDETGVYDYHGGIVVGVPPGDERTLAVEVRAGDTLVFLDGVFVGSFDAIGPGGVGLVTSQASVAFDDLRITGIR